MKTFREFLAGDSEDSEEKEIDEAVSVDAKTFMKEFNAQVSMLKEDVKNSESNNDWKNRLISIANLISKVK